MSALLNYVDHQLQHGWALWTALLRHQTPLWDPYGAALSLLLLVIFAGLTVKFIRD